MQGVVISVTIINNNKLLTSQCVTKMYGNHIKYIVYLNVSSPC